MLSLSSSSWLDKAALLIAAATLLVSCRRPNGRPATHDDSEAITQLPIPCSSDGWCRASPYAPEVRIATSTVETWRLVDHTQLFRKRNGQDESWRRIPLPSGYGTEITSAGGKLWVLSPQCHWVHSRQRQVFDRRRLCTATTIRAYDGQVWTEQQFRNHVHSIWAASANDVWAVGGDDEDFKAPVGLFHWDGSRWVSMNDNVGQNDTGPLRQVVGTSPSNVWAVGGENAIHWDGKALFPYGLDRLDSSVGCRGCKVGPQPRILCNYDQIIFSSGAVALLPDEDSPFFCPLQALNSENRFEEVLEGQRPDLDQLLRERFASPRKPRPAFTGPVRDLHSVVSVGTTVWASASYSPDRHHQDDREDPGVLVGFDGIDWREWNVPARGNRWCKGTYRFPNQVVSDGKVIVAVNDHGYPAQIVDGQWRELGHREWPFGENTPQLVTICAIWTDPGLPVFIANGRGLEIWNRAQRNKVKIEASFRTSPTVLWASAVNDAWIATIPCREDLVYYDQDSCPARLYHFDGHRVIEYPVNPPEQIYRAIHGSNRSDVWLVGDAGFTAHFDGKSWSSMPSGTTHDLRAVITCGPGNAWAAGDRGTILHWDGRAWHPMDSGTGQDLLGITGCASGTLWVVGSGGTILRRADARPQPSPG